MTLTIAFEEIKGSVNPSINLNRALEPLLQMLLDMQVADVEVEAWVWDGEGHFQVFILVELEAYISQDRIDWMSDFLEERYS